MCVLPIIIMDPLIYWNHPNIVKKYPKLRIVALKKNIMIFKCSIFGSINFWSVRKSANRTEPKSDVKNRTVENSNYFIYHHDILSKLDIDFNFLKIKLFFQQIHTFERSSQGQWKSETFFINLYFLIQMSYDCDPGM